MKLTKQDNIAARKKVLQIPSKVIQYRKLSYFCNVKTLQRRREKYKPNCRSQKHLLSTKYHMFTINGSRYRMCQKIILRYFNISLKRLHTITKTIKSGNDIKENIEGDHRSEK